MARSAKPRKRKPAPQRSKFPRYVVKLHEDDFFDEEDAEVLRFDSFDDAVECCADLNIPFFVDAETKSWSSGLYVLMTKDIRKQPVVRSGSLRAFLPISAPAVCTARNAVWFTGRTVSPSPSDASPFYRYISAGKSLT
ncbi:hypothetical protein QUQ82_004509 [Escherichia coli]|nr:hypothetical protein [Escherichia coli]